MQLLINQPSNHMQDSFLADRNVGVKFEHADNEISSISIYNVYSTILAYKPSWIRTYEVVNFNSLNTTFINEEATKKIQSYRIWYIR